MLKYIVFPLFLLVSNITNILASSFNTLQEVLQGVDPKELQVSDMNNDGLMDIIFIDQGQIKIIYQEPPFTNQKSLLLDGTSKYLLLPHNSDFISGSFSMSIWIKPVIFNAVAHTRIIEKTGTGNDCYSLRLLASSNRLSFMTFSGTQWYYFTPTQVLQTDTWYNIIVVNDVTAGKINIYLNGSLISSGTFDVPLNQGSTPVTIGASNSSSGYLNGYVDEFSFFNIALNNAECSLIYNNGTPDSLKEHPQKSSLKCWLRMGDITEDNETIINDISKNSNNATPKNIVSNDFQTIIPVK